MDRNEPLLVAASYFWSDTLNAFLFGHGPVKPTLADVLMLTCCNIFGLDTFFLLPSKATYQIETRQIKGWKGYIERYSKKEGSVDIKEHSAFLDMWLEHFVFCGIAVSLATHYQRLAEHLALRNNLRWGSISWDQYTVCSTRFVSN